MIVFCLTLSCFSYLADAYEPIEIYQFNIAEGWNLVSIPLIPLDAKASVVFPQASVKQLSYWNPATQSYVLIKDNGVWKDPNYCIQVGDAYWLKTDSVITISIYGVRPQFPFIAKIRTRAGELHDDMFGVPITSPIGWADVSIFNLNITSLFSFDAIQQVWVRYYPENLSSFVFEPGKGYDIKTWQPGAIMFFSYLTTPEFNQLKSDYDSLNSTYSSLLASYSSLETSYNNLQSSHNNLSSSYNSLQDSFNSNYSSLLSNYNSLQANFNSLNSSYNSLLARTANYSSLQTSYDSLLGNYSALQTSYNSLSSSYDSLQTSYNSLNSNYSTLQASYNTLDQNLNGLMSDHASLQSQNQSMLNQLNTTTYLTYALVVTTIALTATTIYFARRRPKTRIAEGSPSSEFAHARYCHSHKNPYRQYSKQRTVIYNE